jgi:hypothetical protein
MARQQLLQRQRLQQPLQRLCRRGLFRQECLGLERKAREVLVTLTRVELVKNASICST